MFDIFRAELVEILRPRTRFAIYCDMFIGLAITVVLTLGLLQSVRIPPTQFTDLLTFYLDPMLIQILTYAAAIVIAWLLLGPKRRMTWLGLAVWLAVGVLLVTVQEQYILKAAFGYVRAVTDYTQPWLVQLVESPSSRLSVPSGFTLRQTFLLVVLLHFLGALRPGLKTLKSIGIFAIFLIPSAFVIFNRLYRGDHLLFDVGIGVLIGIVWYWLWVAFTIDMFSKDPKDNLSSDVYFPAFASFFVLFLFCQDSGLWLLYLAIMTVWAIAPILVVQRRKRRGAA